MKASLNPKACPFCLHEFQFAKPERQDCPQTSHAMRPSSITPLLWNRHPGGGQKVVEAVARAPKFALRSCVLRRPRLTEWASSHCQRGRKEQTSRQSSSILQPAAVTQLRRRGLGVLRGYARSHWRVQKPNRPILQLFMQSILPSAK